jgi:hypothetical protein
VFQIKLRRRSRVIWMRMIISDHIQAELARMTLTAHVLIRQNQGSVAPRILFARIGDRVNLYDSLVPVIVEATDEQPAALVRVFRFPVPTDLLLLMTRERDHVV